MVTAIKDFDDRRVGSIRFRKGDLIKVAAGRGGQLYGSRRSETGIFPRSHFADVAKPNVRAICSYPL